MELQQSTSKLSYDLKHKTQQLKKAEDKAAKLEVTHKQAIDNFEAQIKELQEQSLKLGNGSANGHSQIESDLKDQLAIRESALTAANKTISELNSKLATTKSEHTTLRNSFDSILNQSTTKEGELHQQLATLTAELTRAQTEYASLQNNSLRASQHNKDKDSHSFHMKISELTTALSAKTAEHAELEKTHALLVSELAQVKGDLSISENNLKQNLKQLTEMDSKFGVTKGELNSALSELATARDQLVALALESERQKSSTSTESKVFAQMTLELEACHAELSAAKETIKEQQIQAVHAAQELKTLKTAYGQLESEQQKVLNEKSAVGKELASLKSAHDQLVAELSALHINNSDLVASMETARTELSDLSEDKKQAEDELRSTQSFLASATSTIHSQQKEIAELQEDFGSQAEEHASEMGSVQEELRAVQSELKQLMMKNQELETEKISTSDTHKAKAAALEKQLADAIKANESLASQFAAEKENKQRESDELMTTYTSEIDRLQEMLKSDGEELERLEKIASDLTNTAAASKVELEAVNAEKLELSSLSASQQATITDLQQQLDLQKVELNGRTKTTSDLESQLRDAKVVNESQQIAHDEKVSQLTALVESLRGAECASCVTLRAQLAEQQDAVHLMQKEKELTAQPTPTEASTKSALTLEEWLAKRAEITSRFEPLIVELNAKVHAAQAACETVSTHLSDLDAQHQTDTSAVTGNSKRQSATLEKVRKGHKAVHKLVLSNITDQLTPKTTECADLNSEVATLSSDLETSTLYFEKKCVEFSALHEQFEALNAEHKTMKHTLRELSDDLVIKSEAVTQLQTALDLEVSEHRNAESVWRTERERLHAEIIALTVTLSGKDIALNLLQETQNKAITALKSRIAELESELVELRKTSPTIGSQSKPATPGTKSTHSRADKDKQRLETQLSELTERLAVKEGEFDQVFNSIHSLDLEGSDAANPSTPGRENHSAKLRELRKGHKVKSTVLNTELQKKGAEIDKIKQCIVDFQVQLSVSPASTISTITVSSDKTADSVTSAPQDHHYTGEKEEIGELISELKEKTAELIALRTARRDAEFSAAPLLSADVATLSQSLKALTAEHSAVQAKLAEMTAKQLTESCKTDSEDVTPSVNEAVEQLQQQLMQLQTELDAKTQEVISKDEKMEKMKDVQSNIRNTLKDQIAALQTQVDDLTSQAVNSSSSEEIDALTDELQDRAIECSQLKQAVLARQMLLDSARHSVSEKESEIAQLKSTLSALESELTSEREEKGKVLEDTAELVVEIAFLRGQLSRLTETDSAQNEQITELTAELEAVNSMLDAANKELSELKASSTLKNVVSEQRFMPPAKQEYEETAPREIERGGMSFEVEEEEFVPKARPVETVSAEANDTLLNDLKKSLSLKEAEVVALNASLSELQTVAATNDESLVRLEKSLREEKSVVSNLQENLRQNTDKNGKMKDTMQKTIDGHKTRIALVESSLAESNKELERVKAELDRQQSSKSASGSELTNALAQVALLTANLSSRDSSLSDKDQLIEARGVELAAALARVTVLQSELASAEEKATKIQEVQTKVRATMKEKNETLKAEVAALTAAATQRDQDLAALNASGKDLSAQVDSLQSDLIRVQSELNQATADLAARDALQAEKEAVVLPAVSKPAKKGFVTVKSDRDSEAVSGEKMQQFSSSPEEESAVGAAGCKDFDEMTFNDPSASVISSVARVKAVAERVSGDEPVMSASGTAFGQLLLLSESSAPLVLETVPTASTQTDELNEKIRALQSEKVALDDQIALLVADLEASRIHNALLAACVSDRDASLAESETVIVQKSADLGLAATEVSKLQAELVLLTANLSSRDSSLSDKDQLIEARGVELAAALARVTELQLESQAKDDKAAKVQELQNKVTAALKEKIEGLRSDAVIATDSHAAELATQIAAASALAQQLEESATVLARERAASEAAGLL
eukprot:gene23055-29247_t